jgi:ribose transport system substrate-binding protein
VKVKLEQQRKIGTIFICSKKLCNEINEENHMKGTEREKKNRVISIATLSSIVVGILLIVLGMTYYKYQISKLGITATTDYHEYKYHYAIISEKNEEEYWDDIYQGALQMGKKVDAYVEDIGSNLSISYSLYDLLKIAIASRVDGIILEPNGDENIVDLIDYAASQGIPVVTVLKDASHADATLPVKRISYVAINSYKQGLAYATQVLETIEEGRKNITVLMNEDKADRSQEMIYSSILKMIGGRKVTVKSASINTSSAFSSAEDIRDIIMDKANPPDVLVCLNAVDTLCAYQAVVDYNKVGEITIIGYYSSDMILRAIDKNIVHSTMTFNAEQMGAYCVEALNEYRKTKNVSEYYSLDISVINKNNVSEYLKQNSEEEQE